MGVRRVIDARGSASPSEQLCIGSFRHREQLCNGSLRPNEQHLDG